MRAIAEATNGHHRQSQLTARLQPVMVKMIVKMKGRQELMNTQAVMKKETTQTKLERHNARPMMTPVRKVMRKMK